MTFVVSLVTARHNGIGEGEERRCVAALVAQAFEVQLVLVVEHRLETTSRDITVGLTVDGIAHGHVVGRD